MNTNVNARTALSPVSVAGSDWSGISKYNSGADLYGPGGAPPRNGSLVGGGPGGMNGNGPPGGGGDRGDRGDRAASPPISIARSSDGAGLYAQSDTSSLQGIIQEEEVAAHHSALKKLLQPYLSQQGNGRPNKARDKLLRLSVIQFQELSTDVYDELQRREANALNTGGEKPPYLLPKEKFHPKRNQARQKLSTLAMGRFRDLATDVYYELERRFPHFGDGSGSPTASFMNMSGMPPPGRVGSPGPGRVGSPGPGRVGSPGPGRVGSPGPGRVGSPGPGGMRNGPPPGGYAPYGGGLGASGPPPRLVSPAGPPRNGPAGLGSPMDPNSPAGSFGRPLPKTFQSNTIIPNKSTMVEEDDDDGLDGDSDHDGAFGLEDQNRKSNNGLGSRNTGPGAPPSMKRNSNRSLNSLRGGGSGINEADKKVISEYQQKVEALHDKVTVLKASLDEKDREISDLKNGERRRESSINHDRSDWQNLKYDLEGKLQDAQNLNQNLQEQLARVKADKASGENRGMNGGGGGSGDRGYDELQQEHERLKAELREQEEVTEEVRREAMEFLNQMKSISERADYSYEREEKMGGEISKLQDEVKEWKTRYARTKAALRSLRTTSMGLVMPSSTTLVAKEGGLSDPNGLVRDVHITKFQISIDELLRTARGINCAQTLDYVKGVVIATRAITENIDDSPNDDRAKLKSRVSATANNLTTAAKNHATSQGISPVSLVDAAASHLTASIVELIKVVKIRPTLPGEYDDDGDDLITSPDSPRHNGPPISDALPKINGNGNGNSNGNGSGSSYGPNGSTAGSRLSGESVYSPVNSPRNSQGDGRNGSVDRQGGAWAEQVQGMGGIVNLQPEFGVRATQSNVEELRIFLETQAEGIVESIQSLLSRIRADGDMQALRNHVANITDVVAKVVDNTQMAMAQDGNEKLRERGDWIVANLSGCKDKMTAMSEEGEPVDGPADKEFRGRLAALAFDLARETKDLVRTVEEIDNEGRRPPMDDLR